MDEDEAAAVTDKTEPVKLDDDEDDSTTAAGTELLLETPEKIEKSEEIGTEFLLGGTDHKETADVESVASSAVGTSRRRKSRMDVDTDRLDESGPGRDMSDITADAMSIQPTGYTLETAHVRLHLFGYRKLVAVIVMGELLEIRSLSVLCSSVCYRPPLNFPLALKLKTYGGI